jgi:hypothetical protein
VPHPYVTVELVMDMLFVTGIPATLEFSAQELDADGEMMSDDGPENVDCCVAVPPTYVVSVTVQGPPAEHRWT